MMTKTLEVPDLKEYPVADAYPVVKAQIEEMAAEYLPLIVESDGTGLREVHEARMNVKKSRVAIEKRRKELKADALEYGRKVDSAAKELFGLLEPIESHLTNEEKTYNEEQERIRREAEEARQQAIKDKVSVLAKLGCMVTTYEVEAMSEEEYASQLEEAKGAYELRQKQEAELLAEQERLEAERKQREAEEAEARRAEEARLAAERERMEAERQKQEAERAAIEAEKRKLEEEARQRELKAEQDRREKEAAERAAQAERERIEREAEEKRIREENERLRREREEALRPDREKLADFADKIAGMLVPVLSDNAGDATARVKTSLAACAAEIRSIANAIK